MMVLGPKHVGSVFNVFMCKFYKLYICAVVGVIIEELDNMHGVTRKIDIILFCFCISRLPYVTPS